jgi:excisionase family DNA binding protein
MKDASTIVKMAFSVDEAAMRADLGRDGIYDAIRSGALEARKRGRRTLITAEALKDYLDNLPLFRAAPRPMPSQLRRAKARNFPTETVRK